MRFTEDHQWLRLSRDDVVVGITGHGAQLLGDIVFVEIIAVGTQVRRGEEVAVLETQKAAIAIAAPIDGEIIEVNQTSVDHPNIVTEDPVNSGWLYKIRAAKLQNLQSLLNADQYKEFSRV